jgi:hypothetical protein
MRKLEALVFVGLFSVAMGCGSNSGTGTSPQGGRASGGAAATGGGNGGTSAAGGNGGTSASDGSGGTSAAGGSGGGTGTSACTLPNCLKNLGTDCAETGACTTQTDFATDSSNTCYANGVKEINVHDVTTDNRVLTVKNGNSTCFTTAYNGNDVYVGMGSITVKDASGTTVASVRLDDQDNLYKVTCTGSQEVSLDMSCKKVWPVSGLMGTGGSSCTDGDCAP